MSPQDVVTEAERIGAQGIAWTFNEPVTWYEFVLDTARAAEAKGLYTMVNTNGYILPAPAEELFGHVQVVNIDVKGFTEKFYRTICGAGLQGVLNTCILAKDRGVHVELTYLLIPGLNDSAEEIGQFTRWVVEHMGADTPIFFFRFQPFYRLSHLPEQSMEKMNEARTIARREGARYVYFGGVARTPIRTSLSPLLRRSGGEKDIRLLVRYALRNARSAVSAPSLRCTHPPKGWTMSLLWRNNTHRSLSVGVSGPIRAVLAFLIRPHGCISFPSQEMILSH